MEQRLGRALTADGTRVAYAVSGEGPPLLVLPGWVSHAELGWALEPERRFYEALSRGRTVIRYDRPGSGLSDPSGDRDLIAAEDEVIAAVCESNGLRRFDVLGMSLAAGLAVRWAACHPDSVDRLVLFGGWVDGARLGTPVMQEQLLATVRAHWGFGSEMITAIFAPDADAAFRETFSQHQRHSATAEEAARALAACYALDIADTLPLVRAPTHVLHRVDDRAAPVTEAVRLAAGISGAVLTTLPGRSHIAFAGDVDALIDAIRAALGLPGWRPPDRSPLTPRQLEVASLVAQGLSNRGIGERLTITERSAESHVERIRQRLGLNSRVQVAAWYLTSHSNSGSSTAASPAL